MKALADMDEARLRVLSLLRRHGWNATSFQVLEEGFRYAFDEAADACVAIHARTCSSVSSARSRTTGAEATSDTRTWSRKSAT